MNALEGEREIHKGEVRGDCVVVFVTTSSEEKAESIGESLVKKGLAACANIVPSVSSIFIWEGKLCKEKEALLLIKSKASLFPSLSEHVRALHDYEVPEIIALPITAGSQTYIDWILESCPNDPAA